MQKELLNRAMGIFDSPEKWNAFIEIANQKEEIKKLYFQKLHQFLWKYFHENQIKGWGFDTWGDPKEDLCWYLEEFGKESLALRIGWKYQFHLNLIDTANFDSKMMNELLKSEYSSLFASFDRLDKQYGINSKAEEWRNYSFNSPYDSFFDWAQVDYLAWYAGNRTEEFANQIIKKVEKFTKDEKLTKMLYELNYITQIKKQ
jgi:hypothetical protein